ncbi:hypothetical protein [Aureimonas pseudogalii]|uniref:XRE family transcriptional regulator n=1 Tax=Aureimonas pseudogalii TaxID=1744844 RepID=A0A7W6H8L9_9HYPH|nr:hypothetical protein [Aureimonas pseudogalii]MBB4000552.1 hypothetical protein [Aureimonas pseudogalii]
MIDAPTCRAARAFLNWTARNLAAKSGVPMSKIFDLERNRPIDEPDRIALEAAFRTHGVVIDDDGTRATGVRTVTTGGTRHHALLVRHAVEPALLPGRPDNAPSP